MFPLLSSAWNMRRPLSYTPCLGGEPALYHEPLTAHQAVIEFLESFFRDLAVFGSAALLVVDVEDLFVILAFQDLSGMGPLGHR